MRFFNRYPDRGCSTMRFAAGVLMAGLVSAGCAPGKDTRRSGAVLAAQYEHGSQYLPWKLGQFVLGKSVEPHWSVDGKGLKVGVASAGSHDFDLFVYPVNRERGRPQEYPEHFEPTNYQHADRLQGKLLLAHGYVDDNVHVANTLQMADALIRDNKDFDLFIHPAMNHQTLYRTGYMNRKLWDYFVEHLLHETPPSGVKVPDADL